MKAIAGNLLSQLQYPPDLRRLSLGHLPQVCSELRDFIIDTVSLHGGHLGASLGVVELTVALHYVFQTPEDQLIWDVGHQAYGHKILTGRREFFDTNRKYQGLSGFPHRKESIFDSFGTGHSSTSISAALGMAVANRLLKNDHFAMAVIGDGSMTGGMTFEALNNISVEPANTNLLVILNDNKMSIDPNVGALHEHLQQIERHKPNLFENLGLNYIGVVDGHDIKLLINTLQNIRAEKGIHFLHLRTKKGKGFAKAEHDQITWHAPGTFNKITGIINAVQLEQDKQGAPKYQDVFGHTLLELAQGNEKIIGVTPAMASGSSMRILKENMPLRTFDVGIAEQHAVTFAAGLATQGFVPFCAIYSTFLQRAYDQLIHDVCLQNLKVVFCVDRAGIVGEDGATHQGAFDLAYLRCIPNLVVCAPMNEVELRNMMFVSQSPDCQYSMAIRYPRGKGVTVDWKRPFERIKIGKARLIRKGSKIAVLSIGHIGNAVVETCERLENEEIRPSHYDMRFVKPLDTELLDYVFANYEKILTVEDGCLAGGFGSAILEYMADRGISKPVKRLGIPDRFIEQGKIEELHEECGLDSASIAEILRNW